jgi:hypothetical protein
MKVYQIISETRRLDEALPLAPIGIVIGYVSVFLTAMTIDDIYQALSSYNEDPDSLTDDDWGEIFLDISLLAVPSLGKMGGKAALKKVVPESWIRRGGSWIKKDIIDKLKKDKQKYGPRAQAEKSPKEQARLKQKYDKSRANAKKRAEARVKSIPANLWRWFTIGIGTSYAVDYWEKISQLDQDYEDWMNGDRETFYFKNEENKAVVDRAYAQMKNKLVGELTLGVGAAVLGLTPAKIPGVVGTLFGGVAGTAAGVATGSVTTGLLTGGLVKLSSTYATKLIRYGGPGLTLFLSTKTGQDALTNSYVDAIVSGVGATVNVISDSTLKLIYKAIDALVEKVGGPPNITATWPGGAASGAAARGNTTARAQTKGDWRLKKETDPANPKRIFIGGVQVTDDEGYQLRGDSYMRGISNTARAIREPDPTVGIPKKPGKDYNW